MNTTDKKEELKQRRQTLMNHSAEVQELVKAGAYPTINSAVIQLFYKNNGHTEFNTIHQWNKAGFRVMRGEKGFPVWGRPKHVQQETDPDENARKFWPLCYLFSNRQVIPETEVTPANSTSHETARVSA